MPETRLNSGIRWFGDRVVEVVRIISCEITGSNSQRQDGRGRIGPSCELRNKEDGTRRDDARRHRS